MTVVSVLVSILQIFSALKSLKDTWDKSILWIMILLAENV